MFGSKIKHRGCHTSLVSLKIGTSSEKKTCFLLFQPGCWNIHKSNVGSLMWHDSWNSHRKWKSVFLRMQTETQLVFQKLYIFPECILHKSKILSIEPHKVQQKPLPNIRKFSRNKSTLTQNLNLCLMCICATIYLKYVYSVVYTVDQWIIHRIKNASGYNHIKT